MADMSAISGAMVSLNAAGHIAKGLLGVRDAAMLQSKVIELQAQILAAQQGAFAAQATQSSLLERIRELEAKMAQMEHWETERERYELKAVFLGAFAYVVKPEVQGAEPAHWLCAACYQNGKKSILQDFARMPNDRTYELFKCPTCASVVKVHYTVSPDKPYVPAARSGSPEPA